MNKIILTASSVSVSELKSSRRYMTVSMRMFSTRENRNGTAVTEAFIDDIVANKNDYICMPLCADVPKLKKKDYRGLTHLYDKATHTFMADRVGGFYDFEKVEDEFGISLIGYARIDKRNDLICEAIEELYANDALHFSFEISAGSLIEVDGVTVVDAHPDNELTAMAIVSVPAYPESTALDLVAEAQVDPNEMFSAAHFVSAEMDMETVRIRFHQLLCELLKERAWDLRVLVFGVDAVILYDVIGGKSYKAEYLIDGEDFVLKDFYEIDYVRSGGSENMENQMNIAEVETIEVKAEAQIEEVIQPEVEVIAEEMTTEEIIETAEQVETVQAEEVVAEENESEEKLEDKLEEEPEKEDEKDELAEVLSENASLKAEVEELKAYKAELDAIREREAQEKLNSKKASLKEYASAEGLDVENEIIAEAIDNLNYEALVAEVTNKKNSEKKTEQNVSIFASFGINAKGNDYLFARSGK